MIKKMVSCILCLSLLFVLSSSVFAVPASDIDDFNFDDFFSSAELTSKQGNSVQFNSVQELKNSKQTMFRNTPSVLTEYVSTTLSIATSGQSESDDIANAVANSNARYGGDQGVTVPEKTGLGKIWIRVYFSTITNTKGTYVKITKVTGGHNVPKLSGGVSLRGSSVDMGQAGWLINTPTYRVQSQAKLSGGTSFTKYPLSTWQAVAYNGSQTVGASHTVSMKRGTSSWYSTAQVNIR